MAQLWAMRRIGEIRFGKGVRTMAKWTWLLGVLGLIQIGCQTYDRPRDLREKPRPALTNLPVEEQERRIRGRYSLPQDDFRIGPKTGLERHTPVGW
jgi:hypothetical protein